MMSCKNSLRLEGPQEDIEKFLTKIRSDQPGEGIKFVIENFLPIPKEFFDPTVRKGFLKTKYGYDNANDWCVKNWGTKDAAFATSYSLIDHTVTFETFDSPPDKAIIAISEQFPGLKFFFEYRNFQYEDGKKAYYGKIVCHGGEIILEEMGTIKIVTGSKYN